MTTHRTHMFILPFARQLFSTLGQGLARMYLIQKQNSNNNSCRCLPNACPCATALSEALDMYLLIYFPTNARGRFWNPISSVHSGN